MIINKIKTLTNQYSKKTGKEAYFIAKELAFVLETYLESYPNDITMRLKYALVLYDSLLHDDVEALEQLNKIIISDPKNINAWLLSAYIKAHLSFIDDQFFINFCNIKSSDKCIQSMIEYMKSWYYIHKSDKEYEKSLIDSINLCDKHVNNYTELAQLYMRNNKIIQGQQLLKKALDNVKLIYPQEPHYFDILDIEEFFNEYIKGIHLSQSNYETILESFDPNSVWITGVFKNKD